MRRSEPGSRPVGGPAQDRPLRRDTAAAQGIRKVSSLPVRFTVCPVSFAFVLGALLFPAVHLGAQTSVYPVGGQRGTSFEVQIQNYGCISGVLFCCQHLQARVNNACQALLEVEVDPAAEIGVHLLRLFSPEGVSRPLTLQVVAEPTTVESRAPHQSAREAQPVSIPTVVNGRISHSGELDFYAFEASAGEELQFETVTASGLISGAPHVFNNPHLVLYEPAGSWFDPHRARRLEGRDESVQFFLPYFTGTNVYNTFHKLARLSHRFEKEGWYVIEVSSPHTVENGIPQGLGGPDYGYQLRIVPTPGSVSSSDQKWTGREPVHPGLGPQRERDFGRELEVDWMARLRTRAMPIPGAGRKSAHGPPTSDRFGPASSRSELEPNGVTSQAQTVTIPSLLAGVIEAPGDEDYFALEIEAGEALAFEIQTPHVKPPYFNPWLSVFDQRGEEVLTNIFRKVGGDGDDWLKSIEPKTIYRFERAGTYFLRIRDLTSRYGGADFNYRILVRPQLAHVGEIEIKEEVRVQATEAPAVIDVNEINLVRGKARKLQIVASWEEGFDGEITIQVDHLPTGVQMYPAASADSTKGPPWEKIDEQRFTPRIQEVTVLLLAEKQAPTTPVPHMIQLAAVPVVGGKPGAPFSWKELPLMVVTAPPGPGGLESREKID